MVGCSTASLRGWWRGAVPVDYKRALLQLATEFSGESSPHPELVVVAVAQLVAEMRRPVFEKLEATVGAVEQH